MNVRSISEQHKVKTKQMKNGLLTAQYKRRKTTKMIVHKQELKEKDQKQVNYGYSNNRTYEAISAVVLQNMNHV